LAIKPKALSEAKGPGLSPCSDPCRWLSVTQKGVTACLAPSGSLFILLSVMQSELFSDLAEVFK